MKRIWTIGALLLKISTLFSQSNKPIVVKVVNAKDQKPIAGAVITGNSKNTITLANGVALWQSEQGAKKVSVTSIGYFNKEVYVQEGVDTLLIALAENVYLLSPLEVTAIRATNNQPFTKTNLNKNQIELLNTGVDLPFILQQTPSVVANADAGNGVGYTAMRIRGTDATRINVTLNGIPYNDAESQGTFFVNVPDLASSASSIQVQRGVGTSTNGGGAFGASVNISTNEYNEQAYAETNNSIGSFDTRKHTVKVGSGLINQHFTLDARLSNIASSGYIDRASSALQSSYLSGAYFSEKTTLRLNIITGKEKTYQAWNGVPEALLNSNRTYNGLGTEKPGDPYYNQTDNYQQQHYQLFLNQQLTKYTKLNVATFLTTGKGYYEEYKANAAYNDYYLPNVTNGGTVIKETDIIRQLWLDNNFYGQVFSIQYKKGKNEITVGGGWNKYEGKHFGEIIWADKGGIPNNYKWYNLNASKTDKNIYAKWQLSLASNVQLFTDLQGKFVQYQMNGFRKNPILLINRNFNFFNPKIGISQQKNGWNNYASFAIGNKEPNRDDFESGNIQQPNHETLYNVEIGTEKKGKQSFFAANFFAMFYTNQLIVTGKVNDVGAYTRINTPKSYRIGLELQGNRVINKWLHINGNATISTNKIKEFTEYIDNYDAPVFKQETIVHYNTDIAFSPNIMGNAQAQFLLTNALQLSTNARYVGRQFLDNTAQANRALPSFIVQDISINYTVPQKLLQQLAFTFQVNNLWNKMYTPNGYTFSYIAGGSTNTENFFYPMAGTNFMLSASIKL